MRIIAAKFYVRLSFVMWASALLSSAISLVLGGLDDTTLLAWQSDRDDSIYDIYVWDNRTRVVFNVSQSPAFDLNPVWSNDGKLAWGLTAMVTGISMSGTAA